MSEDGSTGLSCRARRCCCSVPVFLFFLPLPFFVAGGAWWPDAADEYPFDAGRAPLSRSALTTEAVTSADADAWAAERGTQGPSEAWEARGQDESPAAALVVAGDGGNLAEELAKTISARSATEAPPAAAPVTKDERCLCLEAWAGDRGGGLDFEGL